MRRVLIAEDEIAIADLIDMSLGGAGYHCEKARDGQEALELLENAQIPYDLLLLDVMMPRMDGFELMEHIEPMGIPVIFITAKVSVKDRIHGLSLGADDYIVKPFEIAELIARVEALMRRYHKSESLLTAGEVEIDMTARTVKKNGVPIELTVKEFDLLHQLIQNKGVVLYRERLFELVWGGFYSPESRTLDLHIQRLRKKLQWQKRIKTVYKIGYKLEVEP